MNKATPNKTGLYWWKWEPCADWEPVRVASNKEGDLWCFFIGSNMNSHITAVGGEWGGPVSKIGLE